jgi:hypothetical protein
VEPIKVFFTFFTGEKKGLNFEKFITSARRDEDGKKPPRTIR